ncbi:hypothetical protein GT002_38660, partial [Streptomyces sp. SID4917]|nr:hypothetical protein [Streptomyces sp. SID4917]
MTGLGIAVVVVMATIAFVGLVASVGNGGAARRRRRGAARGTAGSG